MPLTDKIILNSLSSVRTIEDSYTSSLVSVMGTLERDLISLMGGGTTEQIVDTALARQNIERVLVDSGYYETTGDLLSKGYQDTIEESYKVYQQSIGANFQFADVSLGRLNSIKDMDLSKFGNLGDTFADDMTRVLLDLNFGTIDAKGARDILASSVSKFSQHAQTWVTTGLSGIYRESSIMLAQDNGITKYMYVGPGDRITRPFCMDLLGKRKAYTVDEISKMNNGQGLSVLQFGGGFNCRHQWVGVE